MKKIDISELFQSLEKLGMSREELFQDQSLKIIQREWKNLVGDFFADQSFPDSLKEGRLVVICKHSLISQEMEFQKQEILRKIASKNVPNTISKIVLKTGIIPRF
ncbi:DUF721 domain-containing protein [Leptospira idonii]|uniref:DUF721 domain-containing protein n=1 Tax=Leptospira idonii TaxID=1193500 RepID=A0A4R9M0S3_9LEPT|nr:DUF721 domain-containing protein [Leptospira idonii]TGN20324.1 DUF721 domain-containing protein [Leptospira idonii]